MRLGGEEDDVALETSLTQRGDHGPSGQASTDDDDRAHACLLSDRASWRVLARNSSRSCPFSPGLRARRSSRCDFRRHGLHAVSYTCVPQRPRRRFRAGDVLLEVLGQLVQGLVEAHGCDDTRATLTPTPGECCVTCVQSDDLDSGS